MQTQKNNQNGILPDWGCVFIWNNEKGSLTKTADRIGIVSIIDAVKKMFI